MSFGPINARIFWKKLEKETKNNGFVRGSIVRSSCIQSREYDMQHKPIIQQSIYCTSKFIIVSQLF